MLFEKLIDREVARRMHEENMRREIWERLDRQQKQIEELQFTVECMKHPAEKRGVPKEEA